MFRFITIFLLIMLFPVSHAESIADTKDQNMLGAPAACTIGEGQWGGGPAVDLEYWSDANEDLLIVGAGAELVIFDVDTPTAPVELGRALVSHPAASISVSADGSMAAVSDWFDNVTLVDISNRIAPVARGTYAWPGIQQPTGMALDGDYLYVAVRTIGLSVLDISNPDSPSFVANSDHVVTNFVFDVALYGGYAYLGQSDDGLQIVDISDPANPATVGPPAISTGAGQITIDGNRAYVTRGGSGFDILDLSTPTSPALLGNFDGSGFDYEATVLPGNRLAVADSDGVTAYDISTPATPQALGDISFSGYRLVTVGDSVFLSHGGGSLSNRVRLIDFQSPTSPSEIGHITFDGTSRSVSVGVDHILVANSEGGVVILDSTNPVAPFESARVDIGNDARKVGHVNGYGVASAGYDGVVGVITLQPGNPSLVTTFDTGFSANDLIGDGTRLYVAAGGSGGLRIYDMSNPASPQFLGSVTSPGDTVFQIAVAGDYVYSGYVNDTDLLVIDASNPAAPVIVGSPYVLPDGTTDIAARGNAVFVGTQLEGVRILQNDGNGNLTEIADIDTSPAIVTGVSVDGDFLYISGGNFSGLLVYDVSDPANPQFVEQHNTTGEAVNVDANGGVIAMAEGDNGVTSFGCDAAANNQAPVAVGIIGDQSSNEGTTIFPLSTNPNFSDPDGQALTYTATGLPPGLGINTGSGVVEGSLGYDSSGTYAVVITATDPFELFATQSFTWTIIETNAAPVSVSAIPAQNNDEGDSVSLSVFAHFSDPEGGTLRFDAGGLPNGLSINENTGVISGVLADNSAGNYITLILVYDPEEASTTQAFSWTVNAINLPPTLLSSIPNQNNDEGDNVNLNVFARFSDPDGDILRFEAEGLPEGLFIDENTGIISGVLSLQSSGDYTTKVLAFDPDDAMTSATFSWSVDDVVVEQAIFSDGFE